MKHTPRATLLLIGIFVAAQIIGLMITVNYLDYEATVTTGDVTFEALPFDIERPQVNESISFVYIIAAVLLGTIILLYIVKFKKIGLWKVWFFSAIFICLTISLAAFLPDIMSTFIAFVIAMLKVFKPSKIIHNLSEILIYGALAALFVPIINIFSAFMLLFFISVYDAYAVWKSKHMVVMAKFLTSTNLFAGISIPYKTGKTSKGKTTGKSRSAVLGGGDIGFPLIFTGVVLKTLIQGGLGLNMAFMLSLIITVLVGITLFILLYKAKKEKFYPAMPFLSSGCILGYFIIFGINFFL